MNRFRGEQRRSQAWHPLEKALVVLASLQLIFMPWALGSMHQWSQLTTLALAIPTFVVALITRNYTDAHVRSGGFRLVMWPRLLRFPVFWLGLVAFAYITIQGLNPAIRTIMYPNGGFRIEELTDYIKWLPVGVDGPFDQVNAWRMLIVYAGAWMLACALWVGLTRRQAVQMVLSVIVINAALMGLVAFLERVTGTRDVLWLVKGKASFFVGPFIYKNHAGAYFNLTLVCALSLALWHHNRATERMVRTSPAPLFALCAFVMFIVVLISFSKAATLLMFALGFVLLLVFGVRLFQAPKAGTNRGVMLLMCILFMGGMGAASYVFRFDHVIQRLERFFVDVEKGEGSSYVDRKVVTQATFDLAKERLVTGWGSGGYRWVFPEIQPFYPLIYWKDHRIPRRSDAKFFWYDAHNDYSQIICEVGLIGFGLAVSMLVVGLVFIVANGGLRRPYILVLLAGMGMTLVHSWVDCLLYYPPILGTFATVLILAGRWCQLENRPSRALVADTDSLG